MRRWLLLPALLLLFSPAALAHTVSVSAVCEDHNHVGNDWTQEYFVNGEPLPGDLALRMGEVLSFHAVITEEEKYPDVGTGSESHTVTEADLCSGFTVAFTVRVSEDRGKYKGSEAVWDVVFTVTP